MQEGGVFFGKNLGRKAETGDRARRARTQDRKGGEAPQAPLRGGDGRGRGGRGQKGRREQKGGQNDTQRWTKWHESGHLDTGNGLFGRVRICGTEIAIFRVKTLKHVRLQKQAALLQSSMQNNDSYSSCKKRKLFNLGFRNQTR